MSFPLTRLPREERAGGAGFHVDVPRWSADDVTRKALIGRGTYGRVHLVEKNGDLYVCKEMIQISDLDFEYQQKLFEKEVRLLSKLDHPNVMSLVACYDVPRTLYMDYVVFDWTLHSEGHLDDKVTHTADLAAFLDAQAQYVPDGVRGCHRDLHAVRRIASDVSAGLAYLHSNGMAHRDLKPQNILVGNNRWRPFVCRITDFGEARGQGYEGRTLPNDCFTNRFHRGTLSYMAPEILHPESARYGGRPLFLSSKEHDDLARMDIWAFGMILHLVVNPDLPSPYGHFDDLYQKVIDHMEERKTPKHSDTNRFLKDDCPNVLRAITDCLQYNPLNRKDASTLAKLLWSSLPRTRVPTVEPPRGAQTTERQTSFDKTHISTVKTKKPATGSLSSSNASSEISTEDEKTADKWTIIRTQVRQRRFGDPDTFLTVRSHTTDTGPEQTLEQWFGLEEIAILKSYDVKAEISRIGINKNIEFGEETIILQGTADEIYAINCILYNIIDRAQAKGAGFVYVPNKN